MVNEKEREREGGRDTEGGRERERATPPTMGRKLVYTR